MGHLEDQFLNSYEKGIILDNNYIISFFEEMEAIPENNWELRVNESFAKWWTSANGSKFSKYEL